MSFVSFFCCFCLHITEYEQIRRGAQNFLGPRGVKYLNMGLNALVISPHLKNHSWSVIFVYIQKIVAYSIEYAIVVLCAYLQRETERLRQVLTTLSTAKITQYSWWMNEICVCSIGGMIAGEKNWSTQRKLCLNATPSTTDPAWNGLGSNPDLYNARIMNV